jgi:hypothetical protein
MRMMMKLKRKAKMDGVIFISACQKSALLLISIVD